MMKNSSKKELKKLLCIRHPLQERAGLTPPLCTRAARRADYSHLHFVIVKRRKITQCE